MLTCVAYTFPVRLEKFEQRGFITGEKCCFQYQV